MTSRIRYNVFHSNGPFTFRACNIRPSVVDLTGNVTSNIPVNTIMTGGRVTSIFGPNSRNSAFNNDYLTITTYTTALSTLIHNSCTSRTTGMNTCVRTGLTGLPGIARIHNHNLVLNYSLSSTTNSTRSVITHTLTTNTIVGTANTRALHFLPPLIYRRSSISDLVRVLSNILNWHNTVARFRPNSKLQAYPVQRSSTI